MSKQMTDMTYKRFKKKINTMKLSEKTKQQVFLEFKGALLFFCTFGFIMN